MIIKVIDGQPVQYNLAKLFRDNPSTSFPKNPSDTLLNNFDVFSVSIAPRPSAAEGEVVELGAVVSIGGEWIQTWNVRTKTNEELEADLVQRRSEMKCTPLQGKLALGETAWEQVELILADPTTPFAMRVAILSSTEWERTSQMMDELAWFLGYTPEQVDALFVAAASIKV
ncbi:hypothetical protein EOK75_17190 (plasmid) [Pseudorhodobacter turbinis]|uniref:DUF4376 domain-containing protein n=1 Tax=Pseudorhodobacter turbinis TaxID=2500533 RepID=A0A4P8EKA6_9RHOB|nr:hypothetical protein [Pseudorhodobacter turbinis]QCO57448.1 hypothetical protein EOK75_17190 [Pseudorhodobacter turbinis]